MFKTNKVILIDFKACVRYFYQIFIFSPNDSSLKTVKNAFYFIQKAIYYIFCNFFPSFPHFPDLKVQMEVK